MGQIRQLLEQAIAKLDRLVEQEPEDGDWGDTGTWAGVSGGRPPMIGETVRVSMNLADLFITVGFSFAGGFFAGAWVRGPRP